MKALTIAIIYVAAFSFLSMPQKVKIQEYPSPDIRERQTVVVDGIDEVWELQWKRKIDHPVCGLSDLALTCPCVGFGYAEAGIIDLIRRGANGSIDRFEITPLFGVDFPDDGQVAIIQRWEALLSDWDSENSEAEIIKRPPVRVMHLGDYNHDGDATEFYLQTESAPCGKSFGVVIGVSKTNPQLHVFGSVKKPDTPLYLMRTTWEALRKATSQIEVVEWPCGDHGGDTQESIRLHWTEIGIDGTRRSYSCNRLKPERLLNEEPF